MNARVRFLREHGIAEDENTEIYIKQHVLQIIAEELKKIK